MHASCVLFARVLKRTGGRLWVKKSAPTPYPWTATQIRNQRKNEAAANEVSATLKRAELIEEQEVKLGYTRESLRTQNSLLWPWKKHVRECAQAGRE